MSVPNDLAAWVALARHGRRKQRRARETASPRELLEREHGLFAQQLIEEAALDLEEWRRKGIRVLAPAVADYPENVRPLDDRPPLIFVSGRLERCDVRSVAVIGTRRPTEAGSENARDVARQLVSHGYTVVSGLAAGIDTAAHSAALSAGGRTIAVIGTGLRRCYPPQNRPLQQRIAQEGAVVSQFWPDAPPTRRSFVLRNALVAGISLASIIVEAGPMSGVRTEARFALAHGRPLILLQGLLAQEWARELAQRPGVHVARTAAEALGLVERLTEESLAA